jgi:hypothetical protein
LSNLCSRISSFFFTIYENRRCVFDEIGKSTTISTNKKGVAIFILSKTVVYMKHNNRKLRMALNESRKGVHINSHKIFFSSKRFNQSFRIQATEMIETINAPDNLSFYQINLTILVTTLCCH